MKMFKRADSKNETEVKKQDTKGRKRKIILYSVTNASESCLLWKYTLNK